MHFQLRLVPDHPGHRDVRRHPVFLEVGRRIGVRRLNIPGARAGVGVVDGSVYALVALLIGFTFNGAASRFDSGVSSSARPRTSAGTAWQRIDMLSPELQPPVRDGMRRYLDALISSYAAPPGRASDSTPVAIARAQNYLWLKAVAVARCPRARRRVCCSCPA